MDRRHLTCLAVVAFVACSAGSEKNEFVGGDPGGDPAGASGGTESGSTGDFNPTSGASSGTGVTCSNPVDVDGDGDGMSFNDGDCNDCDANTNPGAVEVIDPDGMIQADEDCDGMADETEECDASLALDDTSPMSAAKAIDLCQETTAGDKRWGVLSAKYVRAGGGPASPGAEVGILEGFGPNVNVQRGARLLALSSGKARTPGQPGECGAESCTGLGAGTAPPSFPQDVPGCAGSTSINDDVGLEVTLRSPTNATGYQFLFKFQSFEFPEWVCTSYNDQFIALVNPPPMGSINGNISFDSQNNPVSVNIAFFDVCDPSGQSSFGEFCQLLGMGSCPAPPSPYCPSGPGELQGTGFVEWGDGGATSWLQTVAPVTGGDEVSIRFAIWDTGDANLDSTALVDAFEWIADGGSVSIGTDPVPDPK